MTPMLTDTLDAYVDAHATPLEPLLQENYEATYASLSSPQMIAGPVLGRLLRFWSRWPRRARARDRDLQRLLGAGDGRGPAAGGPDRHVRAVARARRVRAGYFERSPRASASTCASARRSTRSTPSTARSTSSSSTPTRRATRYYDAVVPKLSPRGMIAVDNTLQRRRVVRPGTSATGRWAAFNDHVQADERTENVSSASATGVTLIRLAGGPVAPL
jgi:caffeoyl-CoA O-methyltransferase